MKRIILNIILFFPIIFLFFSIILVLCLRSGPIKKTPLMLKREIQFRGDGISTQQYWVALSKISADAVKAITMSEDDRFLEHRGVDIQELRKMYYTHKETGLRGCSTITQQVAKNCFTLCSDTFIRKVLELYWASLIEIFWSKERILEVYLNIVEVGKGLYGIEAAAQEYFNCSSANMTLHDAAELAACLPNPLELSPHNIWEYKSAKVEKLIFRLKKGDLSVKI
ncbi:MAG: transglycosylase domain-containing protein [Bacteroidia bacterium]|nr:transglycosylase domain-containing protein [Bacteroidia bacterium]